MIAAPLYDSERCKGQYERPGAGEVGVGANARKSGGARSCYTRTGAPKTAFETKKAAERAIPPKARRLHPYPCSQHGWHLGH